MTEDARAALRARLIEQLKQHAIEYSIAALRSRDGTLLTRASCDCIDAIAALAETPPQVEGGSLPNTRIRQDESPAGGSSHSSLPSSSTAAEPPSAGWQLIATAPKNGTPILGCKATWTHPYVFRYLNGPGLLEGWHDFNISPAGRRPHDLTHWMPLPPAPAENRR